MGMGLRLQGLVVALALALFSLWPRPSTGALLAAYGLALLLCWLFQAQAHLAELRPRTLGCALALLAAPGVAALVRAAPAWVEAEQLDRLTLGLGDRLAQQDMPAIAPTLVVSDRPQTFYVHAEPGARVSLRLGKAAQALAAEDLGAGLYRVHYDPRRDGPPGAREACAAELSVNGKVHERTLLAVWPLAHPRWLALSPDRTLAVAVSEETDELAIVSARGLERRVAVGDGPRDALFVDARRIVVSHRDDDLLLVDAQTGALEGRLALDEPQGRMALAPGGTELAVAALGPEPAIHLFDLTRAARRARVPLDEPPDWLAYGADDRTLLVSARRSASLRALVREGASFEERERIVFGRPVVTLARSQRGTQLFVATTDHRADGSPQTGNHFVQDQILTVALGPLRVVEARLTARRSARQLSPGSVDRGLAPMGLHESADGALLVAFAGSEELWRLEQGKPEPHMLDLSDEGMYAPHGVVELADGTVVMSSPSAGALALITRDGESKPLRLAPADAYLQKHDPAALARRLGERGFYEATNSGISCQSCHLHADSDQRAHNLGTHGLLPTLSVRGLHGTAPYLRDGSFARLSDLDHVAQTLYRGYRHKTPGRAHTLEAFVQALPRESPPPVVAREAATGVRAFVRAQCVLCHGFPAFSGLGQHLASSLFPDAPRSDGAELLDAPSLLSVSRSPPFLSDGRARDLTEVLGLYNRQGKHGHTEVLSERERADLCSFLESL